MMIKGQSILADIFVAMFFLLIILGLIWVFFQHLPPQISSIKEQKACAEAETMSKFLFEVNESDISIEPFVMNYSEFHNKNYTDILNETGTKTSFKITYNIYGFNNNVIDDISSADPSSDAHPSIYILRDGYNIIIKAGSSATGSSFSMNILFPLISIDNITRTSNIEYRPYQNYTPTSPFKTSIVRVRGIFSPGTEEKLNITLNSIPEIVYLKDASCTGNCSIYLGHNKSEVTGNIGPGEIYREKDFCIIKRRGIIKRNNDTYSADIEIIAW